MRNDSVCKNLRASNQILVIYSAEAKMNLFENIFHICILRG